MKIHRERTKDGIRVIFSQIKRKEWSKGLQRMAKKWRCTRGEVEIEMGQTSDDVFSREDVPLFSAKSNTGYATYQEHFAIHLLPLPSLSPFFLGANNAIQPCTLKFLSRVSRRVLDNERARRRKGRARRKSREAGKNEGGKRGRE